MPQNLACKPKYLSVSEKIEIDQSENETKSVVHEEKNKLNKVAEMIQGGNIELTKAIEMVHEYNLMINEGKNLDNNDTVVYEETNQLNKSSILVHEENNRNNKQYTGMAISNTYTYLKLFESVRGNNVSIKHGSLELIRAASECLAELWNISFDRAILEENNINSKFWPVVKDFAKNIPRFWRQFNGNKIAMLRHHHVFFNKLRNVEDLIQDDRKNLEIMKIASEMKYARKIVKPPNREIVKVQPQEFVSESSYKFSHGYNTNPTAFCEICRKMVSKSYLKGHMLRKHQIEIINNGKTQMEEHTEKFQESQDPLTNHELVSKTENDYEAKNPFSEHTESKQKMPEFEEILVKPVFIKNDKKWSKCPKCQECFGSVDEFTRHRMQAFYNIDISTCVQNPRNERKNPCSQCTATFKTKRRLLIHMELVHEEKKENVEVPKTKQQKTDKTDLLLLAPHNPCEMITKRQIFDHIYSLKITPGKCRRLDYQKHVLETVLSFKNLTVDKLSESSVQKLELKVRSLTSEIYEKWRKCGAHREGLYRKFINSMQYPFDWVPEIVHEEKKDAIEMPKLYIQKSDETDVPTLALSNSNDFLTKRQIFDDIYSRKITPGKCRTSEYQKIVLETVLTLKKVNLDELTESSVQKLELKAAGLTFPIYVKWRKCGAHREAIYKKFQNNMEDPFDWFPELKKN